MKVSIEECKRDADRSNILTTYVMFKPESESEKALLEIWRDQDAAFEISMIGEIDSGQYPFISINVDLSKLGKTNKDRRTK